MGEMWAGGAAHLHHRKILFLLQYRELDREDQEQQTMVFLSCPAAQQRRSCWSGVGALDLLISRSKNLEIISIRERISARSRTADIAQKTTAIEAITRYTKGVGQDHIK